MIVVQLTNKLFVGFYWLSNTQPTIPTSADASVGMSVVLIQQPVKIHQITCIFWLSFWLRNMIRYKHPFLLATEMQLLSDFLTKCNPEKVCLFWGNFLKSSTVFGCYLQFRKIIHCFWMLSPISWNHPLFLDAISNFVKSSTVFGCYLQFRKIIHCFWMLSPISKNHPLFLDAISNLLNLTICLCRCTSGRSVAVRSQCRET